jgi:peroxiredoxin
VAEPPENIKAWMEEHGLSYPVVSDIDGATFGQYGNGSVPYNVIIDQNFKVRYSGNGFQEKEFLKIIGDLSE